MVDSPYKHTHTNKSVSKFNFCEFPVSMEIEKQQGIKFTTAENTNFQSRVAKTFLISLKENIQNWFNSQDDVNFQHF